MTNFLQEKEGKKKWSGLDSPPLAGGGVGGAPRGGVSGRRAGQLHLDG